MVQVFSLAALVVLAAGIGLIGVSVASGGARLYLFLVVPVVSGSSAVFFLGVLLSFTGLVGLMLSPSWAAGRHETISDESLEALEGRTFSAESLAGGVVFVGPIPIFFGAARPWSRRTWLVYVLLAVALFVLVLSLALFL